MLGMVTSNAGPGASGVWHKFSVGRVGGEPIFGRRHDAGATRQPLPGFVCIHSCTYDVLYGIIYWCVSWRFLMTFFLEHTFCFRKTAYGRFVVVLCLFQKPSLVVETLKSVPTCFFFEELEFDFHLNSMWFGWTLL